MRTTSEIEVRESIDHLFRHHAGQMVSVLSRFFGLDKLELIEDAVQDSLIAAMQKWPFSGFPENPRAWLIQVAKNRLLDGLRHNAKLRTGDEEIELAERSVDHLGDADPVYFAGEIDEDQLRMIFACCHPEIRADSQVALTLKIVGGFSVAEIARAFLATEDSIAKLLTRAKQKLRAGKIAFEIPQPREILPRLDAVLKVLYLMFNEGYGAAEGDELIRRDLCFEAIRLCEALSAHPITSLPKVHALTALFLFQAARLSSRSDIDGELLLLSEQDRLLWDKRMLGRAVEHFRLSANGNDVTDYHLEAEIAAHHASAGDFESTNWPSILTCYEMLQEQRFSPIVELNRIIVLAKIEGNKAALEQLHKIEENPALEDYNLFHITKAYFLAETGTTSEALRSYQTALELTYNKSVRRFLVRKIRKLDAEALSN